MAVDARLRIVIVQIEARADHGDAVYSWQRHAAAQQHVLQPFDLGDERELTAHAAQFHRGLRRETQCVRCVREDDDRC